MRETVTLWAVAYRYWHGRVVGRAATQVWHGYASVLFVESGPLTPADYKLRDGTPGKPKGRYKLTTMDSYAAWELRINDRIIATSEHPYRQIERGLNRLAGRRLSSLLIDASTGCSRLEFSGGLTLTTTELNRRFCRQPHWLLRLGPDDYRCVILPGTGSRFHFRGAEAP